MKARIPGDDCYPRANANQGAREFGGGSNIYLYIFIWNAIITTEGKKWL